MEAIGGYDFVRGCRCCELFAVNRDALTKRTAADLEHAGELLDSALKPQPLFAHCHSSFVFRHALEIEVVPPAQERYVGYCGMIRFVLLTELGFIQSL